MLFDTHAHYDDESFDADRDAVLTALPEQGVGLILNPGCDVESSRKAVRYAAAYPHVYAAVGIHPEHAAEYTEEDLVHIEEMLAHRKVQALGEIGLDFHSGKDTKEEQIEVFRKQLQIGVKHRVPVMIHTRDANQLTLDILKEEGLFSAERKAAFPMRPDENGQPVPDARVQLHCFSGSAELAKEYVALGATISIGGPVTFKNGRKTVEVAKQVPIEFIMTETDAPYLTPEPFRGRPNRSPYIEHIIRRIALIKDMEYEAAEEILYENGCRFFDIPKDEEE